MKLKKFPFIQQLDGADCGLTCIRIVSKYYGVNIAVSNQILSLIHI